MWFRPLRCLSSTVRDLNSMCELKLTALADNIINRNYCKKALEKIGVASEMAVNGREALDKWRTGEFHMILVGDFSMVSIVA